MRLGRAITLGLVCAWVACGPGLSSPSRDSAQWHACRDARRRQLPAHRPHAYVAYRLDLPVRGQIKIELAARRAIFSSLCATHPASRLDSGASAAPPDRGGQLHAAGQRPRRRADRQLHGQDHVHQRTGVCARTFPISAAGRPSTDSCPSSGCLRPDGTPYDAYTLTTDGAGTLTVAVSQPGFHAADRGPLDRRAPLTLPSRQHAERRPGRRQPVSRRHRIRRYEHGRVPAHQQPFRRADDETCRRAKPRRVRIPTTPPSRPTAAS